VQSEAATPAQYLASLPEDRRRAISAVRAVIRKHLPRGMVEAMNWGMLAYEVPLRRYPDTYNGQPLIYAGLASQKQHMSLYLMGIYADVALRQQFEEAYRATGKRFDVGKSCVRFRTLDDLPLDVVAEAISSLTLETFLALHDEAASLRKSKKQRT
jgi:uncharacterized protein YdhG (YjbR/CyaY superfamily)